MVRLFCLTAISYGWMMGILPADEPAKSVAPPQAADIQSTDAAVRESVARSLPFLESAGVAWMNERNCLSCHHVPFLLWTHRAAKTHGLTVDAKKLTEWDEWARKDSLAHRNEFKLPKDQLEKLDVATIPISIKEKLKPLVEQPIATEAEFVAKLTFLLTAEELQTHQGLLVKTAAVPLHASDRNGGGPDVLGQLLLGRYDGQEDATSAEFRGGVLDLMKRQQLADGSWIPGGQFATMRNWPRPAADQGTTMWAALSLAAYDAPGGKRSELVERALAYQRQQPPQSDNREWLATRLLFEQQFGTAEEVAKLRQQVLEARQPDGGWSWKKGDESDPFTTGLVIYVLSKVGSGDDPAVIRDARKYLVSSQQADGSWLTPSKKITKTTVPERLKARDEIYHYWGTAWAAIGLLETLPPTGN
ncbi:MAG: 2,3-oxidosqualene cyclase [Planctomycetaceae bacterium]|nr:2,3-oxidosqualene cyclase [Planctomycetaceae bacterium]